MTEDEIPATGQAEDSIPAPAAPSPPARRGPGPVLLVSLAVAAVALVALAIKLGLNLGEPKPAPAPAAPPAAEAPGPTRESALAGPSSKFITWEEEKGPAVATYTIDGLTLTVSARTIEDVRVPIIRVASPDGAAIESKGEAGFEKAALNFTVVRLDRADPQPSVIVTNFTGGAHCCTQVRVLQRPGATWRVLDLGAWDGEALGDALPGDVDGDGRLDLEFVDNGFLYLFSSYAGSWAPPLVMNIVAGKPVDVSAQPRFRPLYETYLPQAQAECAKNSNGACAAFIAAAARLGRADQAWPVMLAGYDKKDDWELPTGCRRPTGGKQCPKADEIAFATFPEALRWHLGAMGYMPAAYVPPPDTAQGPSFRCTPALRPVLALICADPDLAAADRKLANVYNRAVLLVPDAKSVRDRQRDFLKARDAGPADRGLLLDLYSRRTDELQRKLPGQD